MSAGDAMVWAARASAVASALRCFWKESDFFSQSCLALLWLSNEWDSRNHTKAFNIEDRADTLRFRFDEGLDSAADFHLHGTINAQQTVKNQCGGTFQLDKPQS